MFRRYISTNLSLTKNLTLKSVPSNALNTWFFFQNYQFIARSVNTVPEGQTSGVEV